MSPLRRIALLGGMVALVAMVLPPLVGLERAGASESSHLVGNTRIGAPLSQTEMSRWDHGVGQRMRAAGLSNTATSTNWSGLVQFGSGIEGAQAAWTVPSVQPSDSSLYSSTWVGVDGADNDDLIQTGTEQDTADGYYAWVEILPADASVITDGEGDPALVEPGDAIAAYVEETSPGIWVMYIQDTTQDWYFDQSFDYDGPGESAEWIVEAPTVNNDQSSLADFGSCSFTETAIYGDFGDSGTTWYGTDMDADNEVDMVNADGTVVLAEPSAPVTDVLGGQDFTDTYVGSTVVLTPPRVTVTSPVNAYQFSPVISVAYRATDATSPIGSFDVRYERAPWNSRYFSGYSYPPQWQSTVSKKQTLVGTPGGEYCFDVRATTVADVTSAWSAGTCTTIPLPVSAMQASRGWTRVREPGNAMNSFDTTKVDGATLTLRGAWVTHVAVVATRCPTCGLIGVYLNGILLRTINTHASTTSRDNVFVWSGSTEQHGTIVVEDVSRTGKVEVSGVAIS